MTTPAVEIVGVSKAFGSAVALHDIDLTIAAGEFVSLLGPSGCGKTTLLRIVSGFESPTTGLVRVNGADVTTVPPHRRPTNIVFQRGALFPHMNVAENVGYSLKLRGWPKPRIAERVAEMLALVRLEGYAGRGPTELSGGQVQRVALARALAAEPSVLLLDEPLSALDLKLRQHMQLELRSIQRRLGATFLYVTHDQTEALVMSDRIAVMNAGEIVQQGAPRDVYARPTSVFASEFIGETNLLAGTVAGADDRVAHVRLDAGAMLRGRPVSPVTAGVPATLSVRPELIRVVRAAAVAGGSAAGPAGGATPIHGSIVDVIYLGSRTRVVVGIGGSDTVLADLREQEIAGLDAGAEVAVDWDPESATVWPTVEKETTTP